MSKAEPPTAADCMTKHVHSVTPDLSLAEVTEFLRKHHVSSTPVIEQGATGGPRLVGFISQADCLEHLSNEIFFGNPAVSQTVKTMMKRHPVCVTSDTDLFSLASIFVTHQYRHLPVVDNERLVGMVSRCDVLEELDRFYRERIEDTSFERFPPDLHEVANLRFVARTR